MTDLNKNFLTISASATLSGKNEFNERIDNVIQSIKGTHFFNRNFGFINRILFSDLSEESAEDLLYSIDSALRTAMPDILLDLNQSRCTPQYENHCYLIQLYYTILTSGQSSSYQNNLEVNN